MSRPFRAGLVLLGVLSALVLPGAPRPVAVVTR